LKEELYYRLIEAYLQKGDFAQASAYYTKLTTEYPDSSYYPYAAYALGLNLLTAQKYKEALAYFNLAREKIQDNKDLLPDIEYRRIICFANLKDYVSIKEEAQAYLANYPKDKRISFAYFYLAQAFEKEGRLSAALESYKDAISLAQDKRTLSLFNLSLAQVYLKLGDYLQARDILDKSEFLDLDAKNQQVYLLVKAALEKETKKYFSALSLYEELLKKTDDPDILIQAYQAKADILCALSRFPEAQDFYQQAIYQINLHNLGPEYLARLYYAQAECLKQAGRFSQAKEKFDSLAKEARDKDFKVMALAQSADCLEGLGDLEAASAAYLAIIKEYPQSQYSDYLYYKLGLLFLKQEKYTEAFACLEKFKDIFRESRLRKEALYILANNLYNQKEFAQALALSQALVMQYQEDALFQEQLQYLMGSCYLGLNKEKEALDIFQALSRDAQLSPQAAWRLGQYYYDNQNYAQARQYFEQVLKKGSDNNLVSSSYYALGCIAIYTGNDQEAIEYLKQAWQLGTETLVLDCAKLLSEIYLRQGRAQMAVKIYEDSLARYNNLETAIYPALAEIYQRQGELGRSVELLRQAADLAKSKDKPYLHFKIAECLEEDNKLKEAMEEYLKISYLYPAQNPYFAKALLRLAQIYEKKENFKEAKNIYKKIVSLNLPETEYAKERLASLGN